MNTGVNDSIAVCLLHGYYIYIFLFSIPVPIPKTSLGGSETKVNYQHARNATFLEKIGHRIVNGFQKVQDTVLGVFDPILETGGNFLGLEDDNNEIGKNFSQFLLP